MGILYVHSHNRCARCRCDLNCIRTDTTCSDHDNEVTSGDPSATGRLQRCRHCIGHHGEVGQLVSVRQVSTSEDSRGRHGHMCGEATVHVVAGHLLVAADVAPTG